MKTLVLRKLKCLLWLPATVLLDCLHPCSTRASWWSPPALQEGKAVTIFLASISCGIDAWWLNREKCCVWTMAERCGCLVVHLTLSFHTWWYNLIQTNICRRHHWLIASVLCAYRTSLLSDGQLISGFTFLKQKYISGMKSSVWTLAVNLCCLQGEETRKVVFLAVFQGDQLHTKVRKICDGFGMLFIIHFIVYYIFLSVYF